MTQSTRLVSNIIKRILAHPFKEGVILLCHSKTRQISHLHGSPLFTNPNKFDKMLTFFLIQSSFLSLLLVA